MSDTIADLINRINNANQLGREELEVPFSRMKTAVLKVLKSLGYICEFSQTADKTIKIKLIPRRKAFEKIRRVSTPSRKIYVKARFIPRPKSGFGEVIVSTPRGVISGKEARRIGTGGEIICEVF